MAITYHAGRRIQLLEADRTLRQGFDGGEGHGSGYTSGGGGGSSSVGVNATSTKAGNGGAGTQSDITGASPTPYYSAGGGGGIWGTGTTVGSGGSSIGGNGSSANNAGGNASGYGSGGGGAGVQSGAGAGVNQTGGNGSAGIIILRFTTSGNTYSQVGGTVDTSVSGQTIISWTATSGTTTFTPTSSFDVRYLVIGGGAGGGSSKAGFAGGGGGGAGGFRTATGHGVTAQTYNITVGSAGAGGVAGSGNGSNGNDSIFDTITSLGGGGGARGMNTSGSVGQNGSSGGGAVPYFVTSFGTGTLTDITPTNVQVGSRLEITDSRKMYSFSDSGATDIQDKTLVQNGDDITYSGGVIDVNIGSSSSSEGDYLLHTLDVPITTADFVLDFDYKRVSGGTGVFGGLVFRSNQSGESIENSNTGDYIRTSPNAAGTSMNMYWHNDGDSTETELGYLTGLNSATNWNYLRLTRTNGTNIKLERFSSAARSGSADAESAVTNLSATWGLSLKYIGGYCAYASGGGLEEHFDNIDLSSTTKLWQEIGT